LAIRTIKQLIRDSNQNIGRYQGQADAYERVLELDDSNKHCPTCGYRYYNEKYKEEHFQRYPEHNPSYIKVEA